MNWDFATKIHNLHGLADVEYLVIVGLCYFIDLAAHGASFYRRLAWNVKIRK